MEHRPLGKDGPGVSVIGLGCNQLGLDGSAQGRRSDRKLLDRAVELGINHFDTADSYTHGDSERVLGAFRRDNPGILVATKVGFLYRPQNPVQRALWPLVCKSVTRSPDRRRRLIAWERPRSSQDHSPAYVTRVTEEALRRLATECLDLMYLHSPPASLIERDDAFETLIRLREAGKIRYLGFSTRPGQSYPLEKLSKVGLSAIQLALSPGQESEAAVLLPWAAANEIGTVINMPFAKGAALHQQKDDWGSLADGTPRSHAQAALRYAVQFDGVTCAIPGTSRIAHLEENVAAVNSAPLSTSEIDRLMKG